MVEHYVSEDYAGLRTKPIDFYYGYEEQINETEDEDGDWCFRARFKSNDKEDIVIPYTELPGKPSMFETTKCLLAGIGFVLEKM